METDWLIVIALIILAFGIQYNRNDIDELKRQVNKLKEDKKGGEQ